MALIGEHDDSTVLHSPHTLVLVADDLLVVGTLLHSKVVVVVLVLRADGLVLKLDFLLDSIVQSTFLEELGELEGEALVYGLILESGGWGVAKDQEFISDLKCKVDEAWEEQLSHFHYFEHSTRPV